MNTATVQKGRFLGLIDANLQAPSQATLDALRSGRSLLEIGQDTNILAERDRQHVEGEVLGDGDAGWFRDIANKEDIVRAGYIEAIERSLAAPGGPLPVVSYWVGGPAAFEMNVLVTKLEVIVLMTTPTPPPFGDAPASAATDDDIWSVSNDDRASAIAAAYPSSWGVEKEDVEGVPTAKKVKIKGR